MNQTVIEDQARYLIEDRIHATHPRQSLHDRRRRRPLRTLSWLSGLRNGAGQRRPESMAPLTLVPLHGVTDCLVGSSYAP